jgi:hypothetical protein
MEAAYAEADLAQPAPTIDQRLIDFMVNGCDFGMEHADGTFLEHLVFCHHYAARHDAARHYPEHSPNVVLLHSILGTATNTFAMEASKLPKLGALPTDFEAIQVETFPSILRLLYSDGLLNVLEQNLHRLGELKALRTAMPRCRRCIWWQATGCMRKSCWWCLGRWGAQRPDA